MGRRAWHTGSTVTPDTLAALTAALNVRAAGEALGDGVARAERGRMRITAARQLGGGSAQTWQLRCDDRLLFCKIGPATLRFDAEAAGLRALAAAVMNDGAAGAALADGRRVGGAGSPDRAADTAVQVGHPAGAALRIATVRACGRLPAGSAAAMPGRDAAPAFLILDWLDLHDAPDAAAWAAAGRALAALHQQRGADYGWDRDNTIGASPQVNTSAESWAAFWRQCRLRPQLHRATGALAAAEGAACAASDALLAGHEPPAAPLHGDLWRGNLGFDAQGHAVLYDPAFYYGDAETDLAMAHLFGGFAPAFFAAYDAVLPPAPGRAARRALYQLYHVLNHANLFGGGYVAQALQMIEQLAGAVREPGRG
jgi:protein-ribulosamine 3-kinase